MHSLPTAELIHTENEHYVRAAERERLATLIVRARRAERRARRAERRVQRASDRAAHAFQQAARARLAIG